MNDFDEIPMEPVSGNRSGSDLGDRLLIGLAAVALLGGLLIGAGNFLSQFAEEGPGPVAGASTPAPTATPRPSRTPHPTATPRALREVTLRPGEPPEPPPYPDQSFYDWVEATAEVVIRQRPAHDAEEVGRMMPGEVAHVVNVGDYEGRQPVWFEVMWPMGLSGWVALTAEDGRELARVHEQQHDSYPGSFSGAGAGEGGFVGMVWPPVRGPQEQHVPAIVFSQDGERWRQVEGLRSAGWGGWTAAWGPTGWLGAILMEGRNGAQLWIWESADGQAWSPLGSLDVLEQGYAYPRQMVASDAGYLLVVETDFGAGLWFSSDGILWQESDDPLGREARRRTGGHDDLRVAGAGSGFVAWRGSELASDTQPFVAGSQNGRAWHSLQLTGDFSRLMVAAMGHRVVAVAQEPGGGASTWSGVLDRGQLQLERTPHLDAVFAGTAITALTSDGDRAYALGYVISSEQPRAWSGDGASWRRLSLPSGAFGGIPHDAFAGPAGLVVIGSQATLAGSSPVLWHQRPDGSWVPEPDPIVPVLPEAVDPAACPEPPTRGIEFTVLDLAIAPACFGDRPMTFRAWSANCDGCGVGGSGPSWTPEWLMNPRRVLLLSPLEDDGWYRDAVLHPDLAWDDAWLNAWVEVTGHFADPAAETCRWEPAPGEEAYYAGRDDVVAQCMRRFVVTSVTVVDGPLPVAASGGGSQGG